MKLSVGQINSLSTYFCSEREAKLPVFFKWALSSDQTDEKFQHEPQCSWFLIGVTYPLVLQSTKARLSWEASAGAVVQNDLGGTSQVIGAILILLTNSSSVMSANLFIQTVKSPASVEELFKLIIFQNSGDWVIQD